MNQLKFLVVALAAVGFATAASAQTVVTSNVTTDTTWSGTVILDGPIFVGDPDVGIDATLTILPGTIVRGQPRSGPVVIGSTVGTPGALLVTQRGRIIADGSASNPIIMTTAATDLNNDGIADDLDGNGFEDQWTPAAGLTNFLDQTPTTAPLAPLDAAGNATVALWGGLAILGNAPTNNANVEGAGYGKTFLEGLLVPGFNPPFATYGGVKPHDNSGILRYVSVRHAGDEIGNGNELNGISLGGVGDGTIVEFCEVYVNFDDGVEWFGGTVNGKNLAAWYVGDDSFDLDEGYTGTNQFLVGFQTFFNENDGDNFGSGSGDKACECDGDNFRADNKVDDVNIRLDVTQSFQPAVGVTGPGIDQDTFLAWPLSNPALYNMTIIGSTPDGGSDFTPVSAASTNRGIQFRNGFAGEVLNTIVTNTGAETCIEVDTGVGDGSVDVIEFVAEDLVRLVSSTCDAGAALAPIEQDVVDNGDAAVAAGKYNGGTPNVLSGFSGLVNKDTTFNPQGNANGKLDATLKPARIDPRPDLTVAPVGVDGGVSPADSFLDPSATFRGAFDPSKPLWTDGWSVLSQAGLL